MKKTVIILFIILNLHAQTYEEILELAIQNNAQLQIAQSQEEKAILQGQIDIRLENPNLEFEVANFSAKRILRENQVGSRVGISQSLLLPSVKKDRQSLSQRQIEVNKQSFQVEKSDFIYAFNLRYLAYKEALKKENLQQEALEISQKIVSIAKGRFNAGAIAKNELLQAQIDLSKVSNKIKFLEVQTLQAKNALLLLANLNQDFNVDASHTFFQKNNNDNLHPLIKLTQKKEALARAELSLASHKIDSIELFSEIEAEPDQDIFRVGVSIPLPIFNQKSQEKQLAKIDINNQQLALAFQKKALKVEIPQLQNEIAIQEALQQKYQELIQEQNELLTIYQKGYAIAKVNLLRLNTLKEELLATKSQLLSSTFFIEKNNIKINYLQGAYNE